MELIKNELIEIAVSQLSKGKITLLTAEGVFKFIFGKLQQVKTDFNAKM